jgi:hypothetical protein
MKRFKAIVVFFLLVATATVGLARLWYRQDIQFGTQHSTTTDGLPLDAVNASHIPLSTGSNIEAALTSLQSQINTLTTALAAKPSTDTMTAALALKADNSAVISALALKANAANPAFTGNGTITGEWTSLQLNTTGNDNHYVHIGNTADPAVPATDNAGILQYRTDLMKLRVYNGSSWDNVP